MAGEIAEQTTVTAPREKFKGAIWTLILLAPFVAEVLSGSTRASVIFVYVPEVMVWGVGALLCRELVRRWNARALSLLLLGLGLAVAEEFLIQQTSIAPLPFPGANAGYGRVGGVNLVYFLFMLGFESVWVVMVPVGMAELFHRSKRNKPWLGLGGAIACVPVFLLGSFLAWFGWTQQARPRLGAAPYKPSVGMLLTGAGMIVVLAVLAYVLRGVRKAAGAGGTPLPWVCGLAAAVLGFPWFLLIGQVFVPNPVQPFWIVVGAGVGWALLSSAVFLRWRAGAGWTDFHTLWVCVGATAACMAAPYLSIRTWPRVDVIGILIFDGLAVGVLGLLATRVYKRRVGDV